MALAGNKCGTGPKTLDALSSIIDKVSQYKIMQLTML